MVVRSEEQRAADIVAIVTGGTPVLRDDGRSPGIRDFDVVFADGHQEPLEVTTATLPRLNAAINTLKKRGKQTVQVPGVAQQWHIFSSAKTPVKDLTPPRLSSMLATIESLGIEKFMLPMDARALPKTVVDEMRAMGLRAAFAHRGSAGLVVISPPSDEREWTSNAENPGQYALSAIEELVSKADNRAKLSATGATSSHLFIWVDERNFLPWADLRQAPPRKAPILPSEITNVWLSTTVGTRIICWRFQVGTGWTYWEGALSPAGQVTP